jgi:hypothetical protein
VANTTGAEGHGSVPGRVMPGNQDIGKIVKKGIAGKNKIIIIGVYNHINRIIRACTNS